MVSLISRGNGSARDHGAVDAYALALSVQLTYARTVLGRQPAVTVGGTLSRFGSLMWDGTLSPFGSLGRYGTLSLIGSLAFTGAL